MKKHKKDNNKIIVLTNSFLSFSKRRDQAEKYFNTGNINTRMDNLKLVLFVVNSLKENINSNVTNIDAEKISIEEKEEEVIFLPFSGFEICDLDESGKYPIISLNYLTKY